MSKVLLWVLIVVGYHFSFCGLAVFVTWDNSNFWLSNWPASMRLGYILMLTLFNIAYFAWCHDEYKKLKDKGERR